jgi:hypothetical protein
MVMVVNPRGEQVYCSYMRRLKKLLAAASRLSMPLPLMAIANDVKLSYRCVDSAF